MTGFEPANSGVTIHCRNHLATPARIGADSGNRTRTSCLEGKGTTTMQYPLFVSFFFQDNNQNYNLKKKTVNIKYE